jgi:hypothetical protein
MPLSKLAKDDQRQYAYFVEGVTLLAWNIAWLCKSQGMSGFDVDWDICALGRNLWNLLLADRPITETTAEDSSQEAANAHLPPENYPTTFGQMSHGTARAFLNSTDGKNVMKDWHLQSPMRAVSKIRDFLSNELQKAEWELLQEAEWDVDNGEETVVLGGGRRAEGEQKASAKNAGAKPSPLPSESDAQELVSKSVRSAGPSTLLSDTAKAPSTTSGTSGWMKLRTRSSSEQK